MKFRAGALLLFLFLGGNSAYPAAHPVIPAKATGIFMSGDRNIHPGTKEADAPSPAEEFRVQQADEYQSAFTKPDHQLINGILSGAVIVLLLFCLFLFISIKDRLYLYYILYVLLICFWILMDKDDHNLNSPELMPVPAVFACILILASVSLKIKAQNRQTWLYLAATFPLVFFGLAEVWIHAGSTETGNAYLSAFGMQTGLILEVMILTFHLAQQFNSYRLEREALLQAINIKQQEITSGFIDTQELERRRISDQLHDDVGSMLSIASWQISSVLTAEGYVKESAKEKLEEAEEVLKHVAQSIRTLGHTLSPWGIQKYGMNKVLTDLAYQINISEKTALEYAIIGFESCGRYPIPFLNDLYRIIQELLTNIVRHASANNAYLEVVEHSDHVNIIVEDNGKGIEFPSSPGSAGIGLESIRSRITYFKGNMEIRKKPEQGTIVVIEIPIMTTSI